MVNLNNPFFSDKDLRIDSAHQDMGYHTVLGDYVWNEKYKWDPLDNTFNDTLARVAGAINAGDQNLVQDSYWAMEAGVFMPAGRILAGAGTTKRVTLMNCYVAQTIPDSMEGIMETLGHAAFVLQQGGGIGMDFSTLRPNGANLKRTGSAASGPMPFMDMWHSMSDTIMSAGHRRGAMMGTMCDTHPDLPSFIIAKQKAGRLTNFNVSILVSDALMEAVREDQDWMLYFSVPPKTRDPELVEFDFDENGVQQYVYRIMRARDLWELITKNTFEWSEPGVIFIDRINDMNNLHYVEEIRCTNPCGEQPLPPHGTCNLGALNVARMVKNPYRENATFNFELLRKVSSIGMRFLDNVIDVTNYPLEQQKTEEREKRRTGLGLTGLGDAVAQLRMRYGSAQSAAIAERIMRTICETAYMTSVSMAQEKDSFTVFDADRYLAPNTFAGSRLSSEIQDSIRKHGIRNSLLLTIAPTGTTTLVFGDGSSGVEPEFEHMAKRKKINPKGEWEEFIREGYASRLYKFINGQHVELPSYMVTMKDLTIADHIAMQAACQRWVDASVSKTINVPTEMTYEQFVNVYEMAYTSGCKGCTTYRPSDVRGSILSTLDAKPAKESTTPAANELSSRPDILHGTTYKIKWPRRKAAIYVTINNDISGKPFEIFIQSKDGAASEWTTALSLMVTALFRKGGDTSFISRELASITSFQDSTYLGGKFYPSLPAYLGHVIQQHLGVVTNTNPNIVIMDDIEMQPMSSDEQALLYGMLDEICPECSAPGLIRQEQCKKCTNCGYSSC